MGIADRISARIYQQIGIHMFLAMGVGCLEDGNAGLRRTLSECIQLGDSLKNSYGNTVQIYVIKLDRSFLLNNENRTRQVCIMKNIVNLAKDLNAQVVCEGVETENDTDLMMEIGAYVAQGYHYCKPVAEDIFEKMLDNGIIDF